MADGYLERGAIVTLQVATKGVPGPVTWTADPAELVEFQGDDLVRLLEPGLVTFRAEAGDFSGEFQVEVGLPPVIVFDLEVDGNRDIYRMLLDGDELIRLSTHPSQDRTPTVAGDTVIFVSYRDGKAELYSVPLSGGAETRLTQSAGEKGYPSLSRDGKRLAFTNDQSGVPKLWHSKPDGSGAARAAPSFGYGGAIDVSPDWSPDGSRLVFVSTTAGSADLYLFRPSNGRVDTLLVAGSPEVEPAWSPDGRWIAFASERGGQTDLYMIEVRTGELRQLTDRVESDAAPAWLADGRLVYQSWVGGVPTLRWLDPMDPETIHEIPLSIGEPGKIAAPW